MKRRFFLLPFAFIMLGSFFVFHFVFSANSDIVINEINSYSSSAHDWIEIWNKGSEAVDIDNWKFWENSANHGLTATATTDSIIAPDEYAVISADTSQFLIDNPGFAGSIFYSALSGGLNKNGEEVGLKTNVDESSFVERFSFVSSSSHSLERRNPFLADYTAANWQEHATGNTVGAVNSNFATTSPPPPSQGGDNVVTTSPPYEGGGQEGVSTATLWSQIKINEIMVDPASGNEWVELYNGATSSLDLSGGILCDNRTSTTCVIAEPTSTIPAQGRVVIYLSGSRLNNDGDSVILKNPDGMIVDEMRYGSGAAGTPAEGQALARRTDGLDTNSDSADWAISTQPTPGASNAIVAPTPRPSGGGGGGGTSPTTQTPPATSSQQINTTTIGCRDGACPVSTTPFAIILNEIYPNPPGSDADGEFIEIKNTSSVAVDLTGWKLADLSGSFSLHGTILPGQILLWRRQQTGLSLNNTSREDVKLVNQGNVNADIVSYNGAIEGQSYSRGVNGWQWTSSPTPGQENVVVVPDSVNIVWKVNAPSRAEPGEMLVFDAEDSADPRGGLLNFSWNFGDGAILPGGEVEHAFASSGIFMVRVSATSSAGTRGEYSFPITVGQGLSIPNSPIIVSEVAPNPEGDDSREFVELFNNSTTTVDLSGWKLAAGGRVYVIPSSTFIAAQGALVFYKRITRFSFNNFGDKVELLTPRNELIDMVRFGRSEAGMSYALVNGEWRWGEESPGYANLVGGSTALSLDADARDTSLKSKARPQRFAASDGGQVKSLKSVSAKAAKVKTTAKKTVKRTAKAPRKAAYPAMTIAAAREAAKNANARLRGIVAVLPGVFGSQYFYIVDGSSGIQIYQNKKMFPELEIGDVVEVKGVISEGTGQRRVKVKQKADIDILATGRSISSTPLALAEFEESALGNLVQIEGEITEIKSNFMYVDDGEDEAIVYFKKGTRIDKKKLREGENVRVEGILEQGKNGWQVWPRAQTDLVALGPSEDLLVKQVALEKDEQKETAEKYLTATAGGITTLLLGFLARARGAILVGAGKKIITVAARLVRRG